MKYSVNIEVIYKELPFAERFAAAKRDGFDYVEIWDWESKDLNELLPEQYAAEIIRMVNSLNVKNLYDAYHMYLNEGKIIETLRKYQDLIGCIHIADAPGRGEPGTGCINYRAVLQDLYDHGYGGMIAFELYPRNGSEVAIKAINEVRAGL